MEITKRLRLPINTEAAVTGDLDMKAVLRSIPDSPGVYTYRDAAGQVLYVGKGKNLRRRIRSYFAPEPQWEKYCVSGL